MHAVTMRNKPKRTTITLPPLKPCRVSKGQQATPGLAQGRTGIDV